MSIESFHDGGGYALPDLPMTERTSYEGRVGRWVVPQGSFQRGLEDYRKFVKHAHAGPDDVRPLEERERFEHLTETLGVLPDLAPLTSIGSELARYPAIHKLQYDRLQQQTAVKIPLADLER